MNRFPPDRMQSLRLVERRGPPPDYVMDDGVRSDRPGSGGGPVGPLVEGALIGFLVGLLVGILATLIILVP